MCSSVQGAIKVATLGKQMRGFSLRSLVRSAYLSRKHTRRWDALLVGRNAICQIDSGAAIDIAADGRFLFATGDRDFGATHADLGRSKLRVVADGRLRITGGNARIGPCSVLHIEGDFEMGASYINSHTRILCGDTVTIGDGCAIAWGVELLDDDRHQLFVAGEPTRKTAPIVIEDDVWIGNNVVVKKGATIGEGAVVASGSVVTGDVPPATLAGGNPATVLKEDISWQ